MATFRSARRTLSWSSALTSFALVIAGSADVYLDGTLSQSDIDAYAPSVTKQVVLLRRTDLSAGSHTIKVVCKGTKNAASSNTTCALDAFSSTPFPGQNGYYKIVNRNSGLTLDVTSGSTSDGAGITQWGYNGADNQNWKFEAVSAGAYEISSRRSGKLIDAGNGYSKLRNVNSGKVLAVLNSSTKAGDRIVQVTDTSANSQQWQIVRVN
ncbi:RICIN domain-containing protein [Lentzea rhizosphaerae]|uniref:RICIN domain-containing protein n=1 Tax=Lentzea rhizosphaerae TaxID=2041025 RepID=A0ABV8C000_9PSEU